MLLCLPLQQRGNGGTGSSGGNGEAEGVPHLKAPTVASSGGGGGGGCIGVFMVTSHAVLLLRALPLEVCHCGA